MTVPEKLRAAKDLVSELEGFALYLELKKEKKYPGKGFLLHHLGVVRETLEETIKELSEKG